MRTVPRSSSPTSILQKGISLSGAAVPRSLCDRRCEQGVLDVDGEQETHHNDAGKVTVKVSIREPLGPRCTKKCSVNSAIPVRVREREELTGLRSADQGLVAIHGRRAPLRSNLVCRVATKKRRSRSAEAEGEEGGESERGGEEHGCCG